MPSSDLNAECPIGRRYCGSVLDASDIGFFEWDLKDNQVVHSEVLNDILGYPKQQQSQRPWFDFIDPGERDEAMKQIREAIASGKRSYRALHRMALRDGHTIMLLVRGTILCDDHGVPARMVATAIDLTDVLPDTNTAATQGPVDP